ncbi:MAG: hypothetical protein N3D12_02070 [Candidatus Methanomethyliaceae archaeon]|nr:hypothetical protein [Candidatus Methanomethyliaceae archaeon]
MGGFAMLYDLALVLGGGKFGSIALKAMMDKSRRVIVVDKDPNCHASRALRMVCSDPSKCGVSARLVVDDAVAYTINIIMGGNVPDIIVPAIPGNSMAMLFSRWLSKLGFLVEPDFEMLKSASVEIPKKIILINNKNAATLVLSYAKDFICSPWCEEPEVCPVTNERILDPVHSILAKMSFCSYNKVFRSKLVDKGVGVLDGKEVYSELFGLPKDLEKYALCVGTACNCHGIITFLRVSKKSKVEI